jgi:hypothetical protein
MVANALTVRERARSAQPNELGRGAGRRAGQLAAALCVAVLAGADARQRRSLRLLELAGAGVRGVRLSGGHVDGLGVGLQSPARPHRDA